MDFLRGKVPEGAAADKLVERALFLAATGYVYTCLLYTSFAFHLTSRAQGGAV